jgi:hypothetical protein
MMDKNVSRREFLRRAKDEAVETGSRIIPGGKLAKKFVEGDNARPGSIVEEPTTPWWKRFVVHNRQTHPISEDNS